MSKNHKNTLSKNFKKFKTERVDKLRRLKTTDPKQYWKIINSEKKTNETSAPLYQLFNFYKSTSEIEIDNESIGNEDQNMNQEASNLHENESDEVINGPVTPDEVLRTAKALKNNKSPGLDNVLNEHLKSTVMCPYMLNYSTLYSIQVLSQNVELRPIFKNKGNPKKPENYRLITLLSNFGKLFTAIINNRLNKYAENTNLIGGEQAGFRKHFSTTDNLFILKSLIDIAQSSKKKLFCCFIDFKQAFDTVWRAGLWSKRIKSGISGKCFNFIHNMYSSIKSKVTPMKAVVSSFFVTLM